ncbi:MAG: hypothetical protein ACYDHP_13855 [Ferrimicrobium sp.]
MRALGRGAVSLSSLGEDEPGVDGESLADPVVILRQWLWLLVAQRTSTVMLWCSAMLAIEILSLLNVVGA